MADSKRKTSKEILGVMRLNEKKEKKKYRYTYIAHVKLQKLFKTLCSKVLLYSLNKFVPHGFLKHFVPQ